MDTGRGWGRNGRKVTGMKQGTLPGTVEDGASDWPKASPGTGQSVRSSQEVVQHNAMEPRDAGKQMRV